MSVKPFIFGAIAAIAFALPVVASSVGESGHTVLVASISSSSMPNDLGNAHQDIQVAAVSSVPPSRGTTFTNTTGGTNSVAPYPVEPPSLAVVNVEPVVPLTFHPRHVARPARVTPPTEDVAAVTPVAFHPEKIWVIGSFR